MLRAPAPELLARVRERGELRGEMVLVVAPPTEEELDAFERAWAYAGPAGAAGVGGAPGADSIDSQAALDADISEALAAGESANALAKRLAQKYSLKKRDVYARVLETRQRD